jgi:hypothetical protein
MSRDALKMMRASLSRNHHNTLDLRGPRPHPPRSLNAGYYILSVNRERGKDFTAGGAEGGAEDTEDEVAAISQHLCALCGESVYLGREKDSCAANHIG